MFKEMRVAGLVMDPQTNSPILILKDVDDEKSLPIWIGLLEATAIATELEKIRFPRPMTHDLLKNCLDYMEVQVDRIEVCDLKDNTYYALIYLRREGKVDPIDARPSDAVAVALRSGAPIYVSDEVFVKFRQSENAKHPMFGQENRDQWPEILEELDPAEFGKYKM